MKSVIKNVNCQLNTFLTLCNMYSMSLIPQSSYLLQSSLVQCSVHYLEINMWLVLSLPCQNAATLARLIGIFKSSSICTVCRKEGSSEIIMMKSSKVKKIVVSVDSDSILTILNFWKKFLLPLELCSTQCHLQWYYLMASFSFTFSY